jgi:hypothetical protein
MSDAGIPDLIDDLVSDLSPVKPMPRLRVAMGTALGFWSVILVLTALMGGGTSNFVGRTLGHWSIAIVTVGLAVAAFGGSLSGLAASIPGRNALQRQGLRIAIAGLAAALGAGLVSALMAAPSALPLSKDVSCFGSGVGLAIVPGAVLLMYLRWGFVQRPRLGASMALLGGFALGGLAVQYLCPLEGSRHVLLGHLSVPLVMTLALALPVGFALKRAPR